MSHLHYSSDVSPSTHDQFVRLGQFRDLTEALVVKGMLESSGIQCFLGDENTVRMDWFWSNAVGGVKLWVRKSDAESARALTQETRDETAAENISTRPTTRQKYALRSAIAGFVVSALGLSCSYFFYTRINRKMPDGVSAIFSILCPSSLEETILEQGNLGPAGANWFFICLQNALLYGLVGFSIGKTVQATQAASRSA